MKHPGDDPRICRPWEVGGLFERGHLSVHVFFLGGGNSKIFGIFTPKIGEDEPNLTSIFSKGLKPPTSFALSFELSS